MGEWSETAVEVAAMAVLYSHEAVLVPRRNLVLACEPEVHVRDVRKWDSLVAS